MNFTLGAIIALSAHRQLMDTSGPLRNRWFAQTAVFAFVIMMPMGAYYYLQWPDWSWLYYLAASRVSTAGMVTTWLAYPVAVMLGFALTSVFVRGNSPRTSLGVPVFGLIVLNVVTLVALSRFLNLTSYELYHAASLRHGDALPKVWESTTWLVSMGLSGVYVGIPVAFLMIRNLRESRAGLIPPAKP